MAVKGSAVEEDADVIPAAVRGAAKAAELEAARVEAKDDSK